VVAGLLLRQVEAGADAVQLFDSWGGLLAPDEYREFALPALQRITAKLAARKVPTLLFVRGGHHLLPLLGESGVTGFSLDWRTEWQVAREMYPRHLLQGNIDPVLLLGSADVIRQRTRGLMRSGFSGAPVSVALKSSAAHEGCSAANNHSTRAQLSMRTTPEICPASRSCCDGPPASASMAASAARTAEGASR